MNFTTPNNRKILIAEDAITSRMVLEEWTQSWGYQPLCVPDGQVAWELLQHMPPTETPRLALLDWMMPNLDGLELCQKIKGTEHSLPFIYTILLTSKNTKDDIVTGLDAGADDFLTKPVQPEELRSRLQVGMRILDYQQRLLELDEQKNKLLGMAAHDLRNPISSIMGFSKLLLGGALEPDSQQEFLTIINQVSQEMLLLLNDLLDISVIESGKFDLRLQEADLVALIKYRLRLLSNSAEQKKMRIKTKLPEQLLVAFDKERLGQVVDNMVSNAIKYAPPETDIWVELDTNKDKVTFFVTDQGPGIPLEQKDRLFGTFAKLGVKPTGGEKATGLGLAIVKKIIESHGGSVDVDSQPGHCRFYFSLPRIQPKQDPLHTKAHA